MRGKKKPKKEAEDVEGRPLLLPLINTEVERVMGGDKSVMKSVIALSGLAAGFVLSSPGLKINPSVIHHPWLLHPHLHLPALLQRSILTIITSYLLRVSAASSHHYGAAEGAR